MRGCRVKHDANWEHADRKARTFAHFLKLTYALTDGFSAKRLP